MRWYKLRNPGIVYTLPAVIVICCVMLFPLIYTILLSFNASTLYSERWQFVGLQQFVDLFNTPSFVSSIYHTFVWTISSVTFQFFVGFALAVIINQYFIRGKWLIRILLMIPWVLPSIISVNIWKWLYHPDFGYINYILKATGIITSPINWISDPRYAMLSVVIVNVWKMSPLVMIMIEAALQSVPNELRDAAQIDGATSVREFFIVTLPHVAATCYTVILLLMIWTLNSFTFIYALTEGGPANSTEILSMYIFKEAFQNYNYGTAGAASTVLFVITALISGVYFKVLLKGDQ